MNIQFVSNENNFLAPVFDENKLERISEFCNWFSESQIKNLKNKNLFLQIQNLTQEILTHYDEKEKINYWKNLVALTKFGFFSEENLYAKDILVKIWGEIESSYQKNGGEKKSKNFVIDFENIFYVMYKLSYQKVMKMVQEQKISMDQVYDLKNMNASQLQDFVNKNGFDIEENTALINFDRYHYSFFKDWLEIENKNLEQKKSNRSNIKF